jgi:hypothetical protein
MIAQPYIGITGITSDEDVDTISECCKIVATTVRTHRVMAGVLVSAKTLHGEPTTNRRYPTIDRVEALLLNSRYAYAWPVVHYNTRAVGDSLGNELRELVNRCPSMRGLQLNIVRPTPSVVYAFAFDHPHVEVIVQMNRAAFGDPPVPADAILYARDYPNASHALLDLSGGCGADINAAFAARVARGWPYAAQLGVAGNLGPDAGPTLRALRDDLGAERFASLSFDAESRVRVPVEDPIVGERYQDRLDRSKTLAYTAVVCDAIRSTQ